MFQPGFSHRAVAPTLVMALLLYLTSPATAESPYQTLLAKADALVTVKFVLKLKMGGGGDNELDSEITCQLIDPAGLVLCSNTELGGYVTLMSRMMGRGTGLSVSAVPTEIKVFLEGKTEELEGQLITRDTDRDLAWIHVEGISDMEPSSELSYLDFKKSAELGVGETFYHVRRLHKFFGSVPVVNEGTVVAVVTKPRQLLMPASSGVPGFGVPVFTADGRLVGVTVLQLPGAEDDAARLFGNPMAALNTSVGLQDMIGGLILPASEVVKATELALEIFKEEAEESPSP